MSIYRCTTWHCAHEWQTTSDTSTAPTEKCGWCGGKGKKIGDSWMTKKLAEEKK